MSFLTRQQILEADDRKFEIVEVPEWGGTVRLGSMQAINRDRYEIAYGKAREEGSERSIRATLVSACIVDEKGETLFTEDDVIEFSKKSGAVLAELFDKCMELNGMSKKAVEKLKGN